MWGRATGGRGAAAVQPKAWQCVQGGPSRGSCLLGTRVAHPKHVLHDCDLGRVEAQRLVERRRALPRVERRAYGAGRAAGREAEDGGRRRCRGGLDLLAHWPSPSVYITPVQNCYDGHPSAVAGHAVACQVDLAAIKLVGGGSNARHLSCYTIFRARGLKASSRLHSQQRGGPRCPPTRNGCAACWRWTFCVRPDE